MIDQYAEAAQKYCPKYRTAVLFVAEAPPNSIDRYFYFDDVRKGDWLWIALMKGLYGQDWKKTKAERKRKRYWLTRFQNDGFQLIDALNLPVVGTPEQRVTAIRENAVDLIGVIQRINPVRIVLIKKTVHDALFSILKAEDLSVVNSNALPFPASGRQKEFDVEFRRIDLST
jgi:hypothetical protein